MASRDKPKFIMQQLSLSLAYLSFHTHHLETGLVKSSPVSEQVSQLWLGRFRGDVEALSNSQNELVSLLLHVKYLASECENEDIVIEESVRESFYSYLDVIAPFVLGDLLNKWGSLIMGGQVQMIESEELRTSLLQFTLVKRRMLEKEILCTLTQFAKLKLPDELIVNLPTQQLPLLQFLFHLLTIEYSPQTDEVIEAATDTVIQLLILSRKSEAFKGLAEFLVAQVGVISQVVPKILASKDIEMGEIYQDIFLQIGRQNITSIIANNEMSVPLILLDLMGMGCSELSEIDCGESERIKGRYQSQFWKEFIKAFKEFGSDVHRFEKLQAFEPVFVRLVDQIVK
mmetsp:Transcript_4399/g.7464  ORF Transcript_4399/g.7464 Transcript_4399/m.7464 type:complete len:343 (-) Transcript_4399:2119-3147(-)